MYVCGWSARQEIEARQHFRARWQQPKSYHGSLCQVYEASPAGQNIPRLRWGGGTFGGLSLRCGSGSLAPSTPPPCSFAVKDASVLRYSGVFEFTMVRQATLHRNVAPANVLFGEGY